MHALKTSKYRFAEACHLEQGAGGDVLPRDTTFAAANGLKALTVRLGEGQGYPTDTVSSCELKHACDDRVWRAGEETLPRDFPERLG